MSPPSEVQPSLRAASLTRFHDKVVALRRRLRISDTTWLFALAAVSGLLAGMGSIAFHELIALVQWVAFGSKEHSGPLALLQSPGYPAWRLVVAPAVGGLIVGWLIHRYAREARGHGVPAVIRAVHERGGRISPIIAGVKTVASALTLGSGGSLGREGPVVQIGASIGSAVGQVLGVTPRQLKMLAASGAAAGLAGIFNAPLGGAFFALEVILGSFAMEAFGPVVVASVAATVVSRAILGDHPVIGVAPYALQHSAELLVYLVLGIVCGAVSVAFTRAIAVATAAFERIHTRESFKAGLGGLVVGCVAAILTPRILGNGYETVEALMKSDPLEVSLLALVGLKLVVTAITLGSGGSGGVFGPSLFLGAALGSIVGRVAGAVFPVAPPGAYALVGMGAFVAGATHAPVSMALMLFEMSDNYKIVLPLLIATSVSSLIARSIYAESVDTVLDARQGRKIHRNVEEMMLHGVHVSEAARSQPDAVVPESAKLADVLRRFMTGQSNLLAVVASDGTYRGVLAVEGLRDREDLEEARDIVVARDLMNTEVPVLSPDDPLTRAIDLFHGAGTDALPIVSRDNRFLGFLAEGDIVSAYRQAILRTELVTTVLGDPAQAPKGIRYSSETITMEIDVPAWLGGRSLAEVNLRSRHGVLVLAVQAVGSLARAPDPLRPLVVGEKLVVLGTKRAIDSVRSGEAVSVASV